LQLSRTTPGGDIGDAMLKTWSDGTVAIRTLACRPRNNYGLVGGRQNAVNFFRVGDECRWTQR